MKLTQLKIRHSSAFTLIEVTIALGICATVMMALLGLLPMSLDQMRDARNMTAVARISEDIINDVQLMAWADMELEPYAPGSAEPIPGIAVMQHAFVDEEGNVCVVDTHNKLARVDGRYVHWVRPHDGGDRYSAIFFSNDPEHSTPRLRALHDC